MIVADVNQLTLAGWTDDREQLRRIPPGTIGQRRTATRAQPQASGNDSRLKQLTKNLATLDPTFTVEYYIYIQRPIGLKIGPADKLEV